MPEIDHRAAFGSFSKDESWLKKFLIASLLTYTVIGFIPVMGWNLEIVRRVRSGQSDGLPEWSGFGRLWKDGYRYWLVNLVWLLPAILSILLLYLPLIFSNSIPAIALLAVMFAAISCVLAFITLYGALIVFLEPALMGLLAGTASLGKAINPLNAWRLARAHLGPHLLVVLIVGIGLTTALSFLAPLTLFLLLPPMLVYTLMVLAHYAGQLGRMEEKEAG